MLSSNRWLSNARVPQRILAAPSNRLFLFPYPITIKAGDSILCDFLNLTGGNLNPTLCFHGFKRFSFDRPDNRDIIPYWNVITPAQIAGNLSSTTNYIFDADAWFEAHALWGYTDSDLDTDIMPNNMAVRFTDGGSGKLMSPATANRVPQRCLLNPSAGRYYWGYPILVPPNTQLVADVLNLTAGNIKPVLCWSGFKRFDLA